MREMIETTGKPQKLLRLKDVLELVHISKSAWWAGVKDGRYPSSIKLGPRTTVWLERDIARLIKKLNNESLKDLK